MIDESVVLGASPGPVLEVLRKGAAVHRLEVTGGDGVRRNVVLGHPSEHHYGRCGGHLGGTIGRYANRIAAGRFPLDGREVQVRTADRGNSLHGGPDGFDARMWELVERTGRYAVLRLESPDGDQGFPGRLRAEVRFTVDERSVQLDFRAVTDAPTPVNLTNHTYFNLDGEGAGSVDGHLLQVHADEYTPVDATGIPLDGHAEVAGTPFDFREPAGVGAAARSSHEQVRSARGVDHNLVVRGTGWRAAAVLTSPATRTRMELWSDQPGLQVYTANFFDGTLPATGGGVYRQGDGLALEPQLFPDSPNNPAWPSAILRPQEVYRARHRWVFSAT
ncbi:aldose epimerase family protein [Nocardioides insulae]|uniref:aldose epimerase family protein n=1 Tax=Nocardioides insulae TaxID=394734 RepID=UPI00146CCF39|nr:aldose epimerase family protein [Nocardioides insulae]